MLQSVCVPVSHAGTCCGVWSVCCFLYSMCLGQAGRGMGGLHASCNGADGVLSQRFEQAFASEGCVSTPACLRTCDCKYTFCSVRMYVCVPVCTCGVCWHRQVESWIHFLKGLLALHPLPCSQAGVTACCADEAQSTGLRIVSQAASLIASPWMQSPQCFRPRSCAGLPGVRHWRTLHNRTCLLSVPALG